MSDTIHQPNMLELTAQVVSAHVNNNSVSASELPGLISLVYKALTAVDAPEAAPAAKKEPFVHPKKSVFADYIICLEDGKKFKMLKRYLQSAYGMTPAQYREKWGLPSDYPMVAPAYSEKRTALAKSIGLGRKRSSEG